MTVLFKVLCLPSIYHQFSSATTISFSHVCCLFIDSAKKPISIVFYADVSKKVLDLKDNVLYKNPQGVSPGNLRVQRCKDQNTIFSDLDLEVLEDKIREIFKSQEVEVLGLEQTATDLQLSEQKYILLEIQDILYATAPYMILK